MTLDFLDRRRDRKTVLLLVQHHADAQFHPCEGANLGKTGLGFYADGLVEHDALIGELLKTVDELGLAGNTIVVYTTDNGPMVCLYPDAGTTRSAGEEHQRGRLARRLPDPLAGW